jgi:ArsR family transcriptional regulator, arsenate/arsenite/antimonite-responsive transcriptional repressor
LIVEEVNYKSSYYGDKFISKYATNMFFIMTQKSVSDLRVKILSALSDPTRLELLEYLSGGERCVCEILPAFQRSQSTISKHLNILHEADILERKVEGKRTVYRIKNPQVFDLIRMVDSMALMQISQLAEARKILEKSLSNRS